MAFNVKQTMERKRTELKDYLIGHQQMKVFFLRISKQLEKNWFDLAMMLNVTNDSIQRIECSTSSKHLAPRHALYLIFLERRVFFKWEHIDFIRGYLMKK